jgi:hypothetical protein
MLQYLCTGCIFVLAVTVFAHYRATVLGRNIRLMYNSELGKSMQCIEKLPRSHGTGNTLYPMLQFAENVNDR